MNCMCEECVNNLSDRKSDRCLKRGKTLQDTDEKCSDFKSDYRKRKELKENED